MVLLYNPRQMVFVSCKGRSMIVGRLEERDYIVTTTWHCPCSQEPAMYLVVIPKIHVEALAALRDEGRFVVNFMGIDEKEAAIALSDEHAIHEDSFAKAGLTRERCVNVDVPRIGEAAGWAECELTKDIDIGDHVICVGRILHADLPHKDAKRLFHVEGTTFTTTL